MKPQWGYVGLSYREVLGKRRNVASFLVPDISGRLLLKCTAENTYYSFLRIQADSTNFEIGNL